MGVGSDIGTATIISRRICGLGVKSGGGIGPNCGGKARPLEGRLGAGADLGGTP